MLLLMCLVAVMENYFCNIGDHMFVFLSKQGFSGQSFIFPLQVTEIKPLNAVEPRFKQLIKILNLLFFNPHAFVRANHQIHKVG